MLNERELKARHEIALEQYNKTVNIEAQLMVLMANRDILPAATASRASSAQTVAAVKAAGATAKESRKALDEVTELIDECRVSATIALQKLLEHEGNGDAGQARQVLPRQGRPGDGRAARAPAMRSKPSSRRTCGRCRPIARCCS